MTEKSLGENIEIEKILPLFDEIINSINVSGIVLLEELSNWEDAINNVKINNIESLVPKYSFYNISTATNTELSNHINIIAIEKLSSFTVDDLYIERNTPTSYWLNCASILIQGKVLDKLPNNLFDLCKKLLLEISTGIFAIPHENSVIGTIIKKANKNDLQPIIKDICIYYCNKTKPITPPIFLFFAKEYEFLSKVTARDGDIASIILNCVILDMNCLEYILDNKSLIGVINNAGDDANDLKNNLRQLLQNNTSDKLKKFAMEIGIIEEDKIEDNK